MYCVHCGAADAAKFCASCGQSQRPIPTQSDLESSTSKDVTLAIVPPRANDVTQQTNVDSDFDWTITLDYEKILSHHHVRQRITAASRTAGPRVTGDDILDVLDAVSPVGFSLGKFTKAILPIYDKLGIKTDCQAQCTYSTPPGRLMLATLCSIASHSLAIDQVHQAPYKCSLSTEIPSSLFTNRGRMSILIEEFKTHCQITLTTSISGQWYDWGKSNRLTNSILAAIVSDLTDQNRGQCPPCRRVA